MRTFGLAEIRRAIAFREVIDAMREALIAQAMGRCETPLPMHLDIGAERAELHIKASYRHGGEYYALKAAGSFPLRAARTGATGAGMMFLGSAATGDPVAFFEDDGWLTDVRTAAAAAMVTRELGRRDTALGVIGTGAQARFQAIMHAEILTLSRVVAWGRDQAHLESYRQDLARLLPGVEVIAALSPRDIALQTKLIVTTTPARAPLLMREPVRPGTLILAVGSDAPGKQELDPAVLGAANVILVDSLAQCERLGELQHAPAERGRVIEVGRFCLDRPPVQADDIVVCDLTGLGVEDLAIASLAFRRLSPA